MTRKRPEAVATFFERMKCVARVLSVLNARFGRPLDDHELADLVQDTLIVTLSKLPDYPGCSGLESWACSVARLEYLNALRRKRRTSDLVERLRDTQPVETSGESAAIEYEGLHRCLDELRIRESSILRLKHFEGLTFEDIARRLGVPVNTVKTRYYRSLDKMHRLLCERDAGI